MMDEVAVVTGASSGIGEAIAKRLLEAGYRVVALQRRAPRMAHEWLIHYSVDLSDAADASAVVAKVAGNHAVRYLVNNAAIAPVCWSRQPSSISTTQWQ